MLFYSPSPPLLTGPRSFPEEFGIDKKGKDEWIVGLVNAIIFLTAGTM